ncbi:MAG: hypothetical protein ACI30C_09760 [Muribaculaceae bacterium]
MEKKSLKKGTILSLFAALVMSFGSASCSSDNNPDTPEVKEPEVTYKGNVAYSNGILFNEGSQIGNGAQHFHFTGDVTLPKGTYTLKGWVYVDKDAKLRIPAGTIIKGDKTTMASLIVEPGGYVEMKGSKDAPIVMTSAQPAGSRRPGDWGGLIICGYAPNNQGTQQIEGGPTTIHGGDAPADNSGIYQYIRVEFAGYPFDTDKEINGVTFGSVGSGTTIDHIQVSYSNDDSFEWFGGNVNCNYLVAYKGWDDEFDTDNGFSGKVQYCLSIRDPRIADTSQSNGFESDNNASGAETEPFTTATFSNVTFIGPKTAKNSDFANNSDYITAGNVYPDNGSKLGKFQSAMQIRRSSKLNVRNALAVGFPIGLIIDGEKGNTVRYAKDGNFSLKNIIFAGMDVIGSDKNKEYGDFLYDFATNTEDRNQVSFSHTFFLAEPSNRVATEAELNLSDPAGTGQNYCPASRLSDNAGGYIGAFADANDNWMAGWTNFDPQNTSY